MNEKIIEGAINYLDALNEAQREAVTTTEGPLLVLAGAGTGKTRVLTSRIAHILDLKKSFPSQILAVTFTNKAAKEMKGRLENLISDSTEGMYLGTFHAIAAKILRMHADRVGLSRNFIIIDFDDQIKLMRQIIKDFNLDEKKTPAKLILYMISRFKDKAWGVGQVPNHEAGYYAEGKINSIYGEYQKRLKELNAVDFGDLLLLNIQLFNSHLDVYEYYRSKFKYILVDEYQDTNISQYIWLRLLAQGSKNICCVGDDDQSIYGWRGAEVTNILKFDKDFEEAKIIRLEKNYRSTSHILALATKLISNNQDRHGKVLWTDQEHGSKIKLNSFYDEREEARFITEEIQSIQQLYKHKLSNIAILVRAGYQTRSFEESLNFLRIPYRIIGGLKFYERSEIKDTLAYIRLLANSKDSLAFERIINTPRRGIGTATLQAIYVNSRNQGLSLFDSTQHLIDLNQIRGKAAGTLSQLLGNFSRWQQMLNHNVPHWQVVDLLLDETGYIDMWKNEGSEESKQRIENIKELVRALQDYSDLNEYLEHISLVTDMEVEDEEGKVSIITIHGAKGLEFETVFLPGWEEGIFPSQRSIEENGKAALEEERRLAYVAITRAKENLYISYACNRRIYGSYQSSLPSRFIDELPSENYEIVNNFGSYYSKNNYLRKKTECVSYGLPEPASLPNIRRGSRVFHNKFGYGVIIKLIDNMAEVAFEKTSVKKVMLDYLVVSNNK